MKPQAVFIDVDNTLTTSRKKHLISFSDIAAIKNLQKQGVYVVLASGRSIEELREIWKQVYFNKYCDYGICANGATLINFKTNEILSNHTVDLVNTKKLFTKISEKNYAIKFSGGKAFYVKKIKFKHKLVSKLFKIDFAKLEYLDITKEGRKKIAIFPVLFNKRGVQKIKTKLEQEFPDLEIVLATFGAFIEITKKSISKASAATYFCESKGLNLNNCVAFGDSGNDVEIFKVVGYPIAVKNASKILKKHSKWITNKCSKNGVSKAIESFSFLD